MPVNNFKKMSIQDLMRHEIERRNHLDLIKLEILAHKIKIKELKKRESLLWQRWMTVQHWINSRILRGEL